ncbi:MAG: glycosyltransferase family 4 protein [Planctomycetes bacterium]|nr:glycosyltransferase family 4 protein [Planctomycetota bacterium]
MHIAIDGLHLFGAYSGVQHALARTLDAYQRRFPDDRVSLFVPRDFDGPPRLEADETSNLDIRRTWFRGRWRGVRTLWRNFRLQPACYRQRCGLLHGATYALPALLSIPAVVTVHDLIALTHPQYCTPGSAKVQKHQLPRSIKVARRVLVPTETVKGQVVERFKTPPERVDVVPWGVGPEFAPIEDRTRLEEARKQWRLPERFVLFVGTLEPKKNVEGLIRAFFAAKMHRKLPHALVLAGRLGWGMDNLDRLIRELNARDYIYLTGYVPDAALPLVYNLAECVVMPSHAEGFGMPVLEAMASGTPVLIGADPALREVAQGAARTFEVGPHNPLQGLREALEEWLEEKEGSISRAPWRAKGLARVREMTWTRTAELTRASYERALA